jgi:hypothetical protein
MFPLWFFGRYLLTRSCRLSDAIRVRDAADAGNVPARVVVKMMRRLSVSWRWLFG